MESSTPKISVITAVFNNESHIRGCIESVLSQTYCNIEYIIIDGKSTDNTVAEIEKFQNKVDYFISEKDSGIAEAMNKGIRQSTGDYLVFLHSDDFFAAEDSLELAVKELTPGIDCLFCGIYFGENREKRYSRGLGRLTLFKTGIQHQGSLCKRELFHKYGLFDEDLKIAMDYDLFLRLYLAEANWKTSEVILAVMRDTGLSSRTDRASLKARFAEEKKIHYKNCNSLIMRVIYHAYWPLYLIYRRIK